MPSPSSLCRSLNRSNRRHGWSRWLKPRCPNTLWRKSRLKWKRFRWNVLVDDRDAPVDERSLTGRLIRLGDVRLRVVELLDRCGVTDRNPSTGERDRAVYSALPVADGRRTMGVGARVEAGGRGGAGIERADRLMVGLGG